MFGLGKKKTATSVGKATMAENKEGEGTAADSAGLTKDDVKAIVAEINKPIGESISKLTELLGKQSETLGALVEGAKPGAGAGGKGKDAAAGEGDAGKPLTLDDINKVLDERDNKRTQSAEQKAQREAFLGDEKNGLAKLPAVYKNQLGSDPAKWADEAKILTAQFEADFKGSGGSVTDVGGANRDGGTTANKDEQKVNAPAALPDSLKKVADDIKLPAA